jgi:hypothetical protein
VLSGSDGFRYGIKFDLGEEQYTHVGIPRGSVFENAEEKLVIRFQFYYSWNNH